MIYNARLFEQGTIERLLGQLEVLLGGVAAAPSQPLDELPLADTAATSSSWAATPCSCPR